VEVGTSAAAPLLAPLVAARWLTNHTEEPTLGGRAGMLVGKEAAEAASARRVLHLEIDISKLPAHLKMEPGDALALLPSESKSDIHSIFVYICISLHSHTCTRTRTHTQTHTHTHTHIYVYIYVCTCI